MKQLSDIVELTDAGPRAAALSRYAILDTPAEAVFDNIVQLAQALCQTPVALVTFLDDEHERQWFKARAGFDGEDTPISSAICAHAVDVPDLLIIPDLTRDDRTRDNAIVTGDLAIRFYAGAPLRTADGVTLGTLCVIDMVARPEGLSDSQQSGLRALAREVMALLELRRTITERDAALAEEVRESARIAAGAAETEQRATYWRTLFEALSEGFVVGEIVPGAAPPTWRFVFVNQAWSNLIGVAADAVLGRSVQDIFPETDPAWAAQLAGVVETGRPLGFTRQFIAGGSWFQGRAFRISDTRFAAIFFDVTQQIAADARQNALLAIGDKLHTLSDAAEMTRFASQLVGETMAVRRAGFGRFDPSRETIALEPHWMAPGATDIAGVHRFSEYGDLLGELLHGQPLVIEDVTGDPRTRDTLPALAAIGVASLVNMPVRGRGGETVALFFVHDDRPRHWSRADLDFLRNVADRLELATVRLDQEQRREVLNQELSHRLKNTLAMVQAIASQTLKPVTERDAVEAFDRRLTALATAHDALLGDNWSAARLLDVIRSVVEAAGQDGNVHLSGPPVELSARAVLSASLLIHELTTNAAKYGALSVPTGVVDVRWRITESAECPVLMLEWTERGGPSAAVPTRRGFGSRLIGMGLVGTGGVDLRYETTGFSATMTAPMSELTQD